MRVLNLVFIFVFVFLVACSSLSSKFETADDLAYSKCYSLEGNQRKICFEKLATNVLKDSKEDNRYLSAANYYHNAGSFKKEENCYRVYAQLKEKKKDYLEAALYYQKISDEKKESLCYLKYAELKYQSKEYFEAAEYYEKAQQEKKARLCYLSYLNLRLKKNNHVEIFENFIDNGQEKFLLSYFQSESMNYLKNGDYKKAFDFATLQEKVEILLKIGDEDISEGVLNKRIKEKKKFLALRFGKMALKNGRKKQASEIFKVGGFENYNKLQLKLKRLFKMKLPKQSFQKCKWGMILEEVLYVYTEELKDWDSSYYEKDLHLYCSKNNQRISFYFKPIEGFKVLYKIEVDLRDDTLSLNKILQFLSKKYTALTEIESKMNFDSNRYGFYQYRDYVYEGRFHQTKLKLDYRIEIRGRSDYNWKSLYYISIPLERYFRKLEEKKSNKKLGESL